MASISRQQDVRGFVLATAVVFGAKGAAACVYRRKPALSSLEEVDCVASILAQNVNALRSRICKGAPHKPASFFPVFECHIRFRHSSTKRACSPIPCIRRLTRYLALHAPLRLHSCLSWATTDLRCAHRGLKT